MLKQSIAAVLAAALAIPALAVGEDDIAALRGELRRIQEQYEARIQALESRLEKAERGMVEAERAANAAKAEAGADSRPAGENAFNPAMSAILSGTYGRLSEDPARYAITGFIPPGNATPGIRGASLKETELLFSANIDPYLRGNLLLAVDESDAVSVEEAYGQTLGLGHGLTLKAGRFFSGIGYLNEQHPHTRDFVDAPLVQRAFLGDNYGDDGVQLKWIAPTDMLVELGAELGRGRNPPGGSRMKNGNGATALFARMGGDLGNSHSYRVGLSTLRTATGAAGLNGNDVDLLGRAVVNNFAGDTRIWGVDFVWKYAPRGNAIQTALQLQGEYFRRKQDGQLTYDADGALALTNTDGYASDQSGWYLQGVYRFAPRWRAGLRHDRLNGGTVTIGASNLANVQTFQYDPRRSSAMLDYSPSEFSRIRLQFSRDESRQGAVDSQWFVQYVYSLGSHGAHKY